MDNKEYVVAVDLGTTKVVVAVGRRADKGKIEIIAVGESASSGVIKGNVLNIEQTSRALKEAKEKVEQELGVELKEAYVGISGQHIRCNRDNGHVFIESGDGEVKEYDVHRLNEDMKKSPVPLGQTIIHVLPQSYTLDDDSEINEPVGMIGKKLEAKFNIITGEESAIERIGRCFSRVGMKMKGVVLQPLASAEAVLNDDERELGVVVVDIGGGTTDVCVYYDNVIRHIAVIPIGGNIINKDIRSYGILERHVENLKIKFGEAIGEVARADRYITMPSVSGQTPKEISVKTLAGIIEARMHDIIDYVLLEIEKCGYKGKLGAGIVLTGGGASLKNLDNLFKMYSEYDVRVALPSTYITEESIDKVNMSRYSTVVGLIVGGIAAGSYTTVNQLARAAEQPIQAPVGVAQPQAQAQPTRQPWKSPQPTNQASAVTSIPKAAPNNIAPAEEPEQHEEEAPKRRGFINRLKDQFNNIFEEVDDEEI